MNDIGKSIFNRYIGIDYSGAETPTSSLKELRVYIADQASLPEEVPPPPSPRKYWTRRGIAEWLEERLKEDQRTIVGIDHGFSFPLRYFEVHHIEPDWPTFLDDFQLHWPTDEDNVYVDFVRDGIAGDGANRSGNSRWRRLTEEHAGSAKSVFHFDVPGSVAKMRRLSSGMKQIATFFTVGAASRGDQDREGAGQAQGVEADCPGKEW